jgi:pyrimidine operon attenuation protein/uracil phosphoribosyltransferase
MPRLIFTTRIGRHIRPEGGGQGKKMTQKQVLNQREIRENLKRIAQQILKEADNPKNLVLMGIITRGATLAHRMNAMMGKSTSGVKVAALDTRPYRDDLKSEVTEDRSDIPFDITDKDVILVDDVMSTGRTMRAAMEALIRVGRPRSVKIAVLIERGHRELPITTNYIGTSIPTSIMEDVRVRLKEVDGCKDAALIISD